jgi:acyl-CoA hydrolase
MEWRMFFMTKLAPKRVSDSMTSQVQIIMPEHINGYHRLFGGQLVEWIDVVAGVVAPPQQSECDHGLY